MRLVLSGLSSAASDLYNAARDEETELDLVRDSLTEPARVYTFRDAAQGVIPASEADDEEKWTARGTIASDWEPDFGVSDDSPSLLERLKSVVGQGAESAVDEISEGSRAYFTVAGAEPVLRVGNLGGVVGAGTALLLGFPRLGLGLLALTLGDVAARQLSVSWRGLRQNDPRVG